jgi:hypothetical protein
MPHLLFHFAKDLQSTHEFLSRFYIGCFIGHLLNLLGTYSVGMRKPTAKTGF